MAVRMPFELQSSVFHRFLGLYIRRFDGSILHCTGPQSHVVLSAWDQIRASLSLFQIATSDANQPPTTTHVSVEHSDSDSENADEPFHSQRLVVLERRQENTPQVIGIVLKDNGALTPAADNLDSFFAAIILKGTQLDASQPDDAVYGSLSLEETTEAIVDYFDAELRYVGKGDLWDFGGRDYFRDRVFYYTSRQKKLELCLPAFPCKSTNQDKVQGNRPDRGEYISLVNLHKFVEGVEKIYAPGAKLWIISDGHVFSDCVGVDDAVVDSYGEKLIAMNATIAESTGGPDRVGFKSLVDLFALSDSNNILAAGVVPEIDIPSIPHHISTKVIEEAELCRRILMLGFESSRADLRREITSQNPAIMALYRGFSRFMFEDLELNPYTRHLSRSQRNKVGSKVAFEMLQRNQAYSNLVEVMFPHHVRLSIHAHSNSGPKFGIQMFGKGVRPTKVLSPDGDIMTSQDLLHVPTPWHNSVVEIEGHPTLYVTKSKIARSALKEGAFTGGWTECGSSLEGHFHLAPKQL